MLKLTKTVEYALISMNYIENNGNHKPVSAKLIANQFSIPINPTVELVHFFKTNGHEVYYITARSGENGDVLAKYLSKVFTKYKKFLYQLVIKILIFPFIFI